MGPQNWSMLQSALKEAQWAEFMMAVSTDPVRPEVLTDAALTNVKAVSDQQKAFIRLI